MANLFDPLYSNEEEKLDYFNISSTANLKTSQKENMDYGYFSGLTEGLKEKGLEGRQKLVADKIGELYGKKPEKINILLKKHSGLTFPATNAEKIDTLYSLIAENNQKFIQDLTALLQKHTDIGAKISEKDYGGGTAALISGAIDSIGTAISGSQEASATKKAAQEKTTQKMLELGIQKQKQKRMIIYIVIAMIVVVGIVAGIIIYKRTKK